jgi:hypothetical protein
MSSSSISGHGVTDVPSSRAADGLPSLSRYDAVLAAIPLLFAVALAGHLFLSVSLWAAMAAAAVGSVACLADALYLNPPSGAGNAGSDRATR